VRALDRKLLRDVWHYRAQLAAIAVVVACGIALFVSLRSMNGFLRDSRDRFYSEYRFADIFARVKRAPASAAREISRIPAVAAVDARLVYDVALDVPGLPEPAVGRLVSIPVPPASMLNELHLLRGRWPESGRALEVLASAAFARANLLEPGDSLGAVLNGRWQWLRIVGTAISPEYVYEVGTGAVFPDNRRFGVLWIGHGTLSELFDADGTLNDLAITMVPGASEQETIDLVDAVLARHGGFGAYGRRSQLSNQFLDGEIEETQVTSILLPAIFLAVTAFLLHIVISRLVSTQREQIAALKAFGYDSGTIGAHYLGLALIPVLVGSAIGSGAGLWLAEELAVVYARFFQFPGAEFTPDWSVLGIAAAVGLLAATVGAIASVARTVSLPPADAMRPEAPARFRPGVLERFRLLRRASLPTHIIARNIERRPMRSLLSIFGLALAAGIVVTILALYDAIDLMKEIQFHQSVRGDVTVTFDAPRHRSALGAITRLPGVLAAEGFRVVPVRLRHRRETYQTAILALPRDATLFRVVDERGHVNEVPEDGLLVSAILATSLRVAPGDELRVEVLEGDRPSRTVTVSGVSDEVIGARAYMEADALRRLLGGESVISGAYLRVDATMAESLYVRLKRLPGVEAVSVRRAELEGFERTLAESFNISLLTALVFACVIAFGIVFNHARVALSERGRELASLRVLGFTRREVLTMLLGEQGVLTLLALPFGFAIAYGLCWFMAMRFESEMFRLPVVVEGESYITGAAVVIASAAISALAVRGRVARLDLVAVLKTRE
jgi:putative ABC transport system permease protein